MAENDVWVADRNFCTTAFLFGIAGRNGFFVVRRHATTLTWDRESEWVGVGRTDTGTLDEQTIWLTGPDGAELSVRRVRLTLDAPTRDGDGVIEVLTNLPAEVAIASVVAELYRGRWSVEGLFLRLTTVLKCEVNTLGYPPAALFGFCVALAAGNVYAGVKGALRAAHGAVVADGVSRLPPGVGGVRGVPGVVDRDPGRGVGGDRRVVRRADGRVAEGTGPGCEPGPVSEGDPGTEETEVAPDPVPRRQTHLHLTSTQR